MQLVFIVNCKCNLAVLQLISNNHRIPFKSWYLFIYFFFFSVFRLFIIANVVDFLDICWLPNLSLNRMRNEWKKSAEFESISMEADQLIAWLFFISIYNNIILLSEWVRNRPVFSNSMMMEFWTLEKDRGLWSTPAHGHIQCAARQSCLHYCSSSYLTIYKHANIRHRVLPFNRFYSH